MERPGDVDRPEPTLAGVDVACEATRSGAWLTGHVDIVGGRRQLSRAATVDMCLLPEALADGSPTAAADV